MFRRWGDILDGPATRLSVFDDPHFDEADPLGSTPKGTSVFVVDRKTRSSAFYFYDRRVGQHGKANALLAGRIEFDRRFRFELKASKDDRPALPEPIVEHAAYLTLYDQKRSVSSITGGAPSKENLLLTGHVSLVVGAAEEPREIVRLTGDVVEDFSLEAVLRHAFVPLHAVDFSRFDFSDTLVKFALEEFSEQHGRRGISLCLFNRNRSTIYRHSTQPCVVVHRAVDLLDLKFKFNGVFLDSRRGRKPAGRWQQVKRKNRWGWLGRSVLIALTTAPGAKLPTDIGSKPHKIAVWNSIKRALDGTAWFPE